MNIPKNVKSIFDGADSVRLAYLFGSKARNDDGPMSDYDFAVYFGQYDTSKIAKLKYRLLGELSRELKTDNIDILVLNESNKPELNYQVIKDGVVIKDIEPTRVLIEPQILNNYFDFKMGLVRNGLTKDLS